MSRESDSVGVVLIQPCPVCGGSMDIIEKEGGYGVRCSQCRYDYGNCADREYLVGMWNALATTFPTSVHMIANSVSKQEPI